MPKMCQTFAKQGYILLLMCLPQQSHKGGITIPKLQKKRKKENKTQRLI